METPRLGSVMSATCTCHRQVFLPQQGHSSKLEQVLACTVLPLLFLLLSDVLLLSRALDNLLGFFQRGLAKLENLNYFPEGAVPPTLFTSRMRANSSAARALFYWSSWAMLQRSMMAGSKTKAGETLTEDKTRSLLMLAACPNRYYFEFLLL